MAACRHSPVGGKRTRLLVRHVIRQVPHKHGRRRGGHGVQRRAAARQRDALLALVRLTLSHTQAGDLYQGVLKQKAMAHARAALLSYRYGGNCPAQGCRHRHRSCATLGGVVVRRRNPLTRLRLTISVSCCSVV